MPGFSDPQNLNRYTYVLNNPVRFNDPSGHMPRWLLNFIAWGFILGYFNKGDVASAAFYGNLRNIRNAPHQLAQMHVAKAVQAQHGDIVLEYSIPYTHLKADVVAGGYVWEIKPE